MILGVTGTNGAGKGTVVEYLAAHGFKDYSAKDLIVEEIKRRGLPVDRDSMNLVGNDLRRTQHPAYLFEQLYARALAAGGDAILDAPRAIAEGQFLKDRGVPIIAVDADRHIRYERVIKRASEKDQVTFEKFAEQEDRELAQSEAHDMNVLGVMQMADHTLHNDGSLEDLHAQIEAALAKIGRG